MVRSHHSHSGQYALHALDTLDEVVESAIRRGFKTYCLTEHMPRYRLSDLYPEEHDLSVDDLNVMFDFYYSHARQLQKIHADKITLLVGFETDYIDTGFLSHVDDVRAKYPFDMFVGSIHHVHQIPIDFDRSRYEKAMGISGSIMNLFEDYFNTQYDLLCALKPPVIGHFDLIRLFAPDSKSPIKDLYPSVWPLVERNVELVISYGGFFEVSSASIRKGWDTPYPRPDIAKFIMAKGGKFVLSDDSHGVAQVGLNYGPTIQYLADLGLEKVHYLDIADPAHQESNLKLTDSSRQERVSHRLSPNVTVKYDLVSELLNDPAIKKLPVSEGSHNIETGTAVESGH